jgi:hypothetical protein
MNPNKDKKDEGQQYDIRRSYYIVDGQEVLAENTEFLNIEEDAMTGRDLVTFKYKGIERQSFVIIK